MVSGVAALLQAIRPDPTPLTPRKLKELLMETGDELAGVWKPGYVRRLNALAAVRRLLPLRPGHTVWVAHTPSTGGPSRSVLVGFRADPLDIDVDPVGVNEIPLIADRDGTRVEGTVVSTMKSSSVDGRLYVLSQTTSPLGDGIFVVNTASERVEDFIPLSGTAFPANPSDETRMRSLDHWFLPVFSKRGKTSRQYGKARRSGRSEKIQKENGCRFP